MAATDARPVPIKNTALRIYFPIYDADGDPVTGASALDSEVSIDGAAFADCTNEATEIGSTGIYYLDLTSGEMNGDAIVVQTKTSTSGAKTSVSVMYPQESGDIKVDVQSFGGTAGTFASGRAEVNTSHIAGSAVSTSSAQVGVNVVNAGGTAWASGSLTSGVFASGAITAAAIAADAIGASELAADAVDAILDEQIGDGTLTMRQALRVIFAAVAGKLSGAATTTVTIRNGADSANVIVATVDADGNRSAVTVTP